jgi:RNA-splicing ligase RtcB
MGVKINMFVIEGRYTSAKVFSSEADPKAQAQIRELCDQPFAKDAQVRIMPDYHWGAGCTIGFTADLGNKVVPNLVGVDIGCGVLTAKLAQIPANLHAFDRSVRKSIPAGFSSHRKPIHHLESVNDLVCLKSIRGKDFQAQLGTLGGGNHFIELDLNEREDAFLVIHSGSRNLGKRVAEHYQQLAAKTCRTDGVDVPKQLAYLEGSLMADYLHDMQICQRYASENRQQILRSLIQAEGLEVLETFETVHNFIDPADRIIRKGAVKAYLGEKLLIPLNMRDGSLICQGKGNADWNFSAPHGAGRLMGRNEARKVIQLRDFENTMQGVFSSTVNMDTLDEAPQAYKPKDQIIADIAETAEIIDVIKPVYNFKAGRD